jgi:hypothetical protein
MERKLIGALAVSLLTLPLLCGCTNEVSAEAWLYGNYGYMVESQLSVKGGLVTSISFNAVATPSIWGVLDMDALAADKITVDTVSIDDGSETVYYPKYITIGGYLYKGQAPDSSSAEYIDYFAVKGVGDASIKAPSKSDSLYVYMTTSDVNNNVGSKAGWYYNAIKNGQYEALTGVSETYDKPLQSDSTPASDASITKRTNGTALDHKYLGIEGSMFKKDEAYTGSDAQTWKASSDALAAYILGKPVYSVSGQKNKATFAGTKGNWTITVCDTPEANGGSSAVPSVNAEALTGVSFSKSDLTNYYTVAGLAYGSVEYSSYGAY